MATPDLEIERTLALSEPTSNLITPPFSPHPLLLAPLIPLLYLLLLGRPPEIQDFILIIIFSSCKEAFMSRNALFKHLDKIHKCFCEWQQQPEVEEKTSSRVSAKARIPISAQQRALGKYNAKAAAPQR